MYRTVPDINNSTLNIFYIFTTALYASINIGMTKLLIMCTYWKIMVLDFMNLLLLIYSTDIGAVFNCARNYDLPFSRIKCDTNFLIPSLYLILYFSFAISIHNPTFDYTTYIFLPLSCIICDSNFQIRTVCVFIIYIYDRNNLILLSQTDCNFKQTKLTIPKIYFYVTKYFICIYITTLLNNQHTYFLTVLLFYRRGRG